MVSVVTGSGLGLVNTSRGVVGANGELGQGSLGRAGERLTVNAANGNLVIQNQDGQLVGVGADIALLRTYNSQGGWDADNGDAWRLGYYRRITGLTGTLNAAGSTLRRTDADGFESTYTWRDDRYVSTDGAGAYDSLVVVGSTATWTDGDTGVTETYAEATPGTWRLTQITDLDGHALKVSHDGQGLISTLATWKAGAPSADETLTLAYDTARRLTQVSTATRRADSSLSTQTRTTYLYDSANRLSGVVTDLSPEDNSTVDGRSYSVAYTYDGAGRVRTVTQTDGTALTIAYDASGRVSQLTDALGRITTFAYDTTARQTTVTDALNQATRLSYDSAGRLIDLSGTGLKTSLAYDADGNVLSSTNGLGQQTQFAYDSHGNLLRSTDATGRVLERAYDAANRQISETQSAQTTRYVYDTTGGLRRLRFTISAEGRVSEQQYNSLGQLSSSLAHTRSPYTGAATLADLSTWASQQAAPQRTDYGYDLRGQLASRTDASGLTRYTFDAFGRLLQSIDASGNTTAFVYDGLDRLTLSTDALGASTVTSHDDAGNRTSVQLASRDGQSPGLRTVSTYNPAGLLIAQSQFNGSTALGETRYTYDAANRLRMTQDPTGQRQWLLYDEAGRKVAEVDALGHLTETRYDAAGRAVQSIGYEQPANTALLVDAQGNPAPVSLAAIRPGTAAADRRQWQLFDAAGRVTHQITSLGEVTETRYDGAGRVSTVVQHGQRLAALPAAGSSDLPVLAYAAGDPDRVSRRLYDADGLLRGTLDAEGYFTEMRYDAAGRLVERIAYATATDPAQRNAGTLAQLTPATHSADRRSVWLYDNQGRLQAEISPEGWLTETTYNSAGQRSQTLRYARRISGTATPASTLAGLRPPASPGTSAQDQLSAWTYDALNHVQTQTAADGTVTRYSYDNVGHLIRTERAAGTAEARSLSQRHDLQGRLVAELSAEGSAQLAQATTPAQIDAAWSGYATWHAYDAAGRRIRSTDARGSSTVFYYDAAGRLVYRILQTASGGEVQASRYTVFSETALTTRYSRRLSLADTAALTGGRADAALDGKIAALADASDQRTQSVYNQRGLVQQAIDALGFKTDYHYNAFGQVSRSEAAAGSLGDGRVLRTDLAYDRRGLQVRSTQDPLGLNVQIQAEYDAFGRQTASVDARGDRSTTRYLNSDGSPDGGRQVIVTDATGASRSTTYDAFDRVVRQTDALGQSINFSHDSANRRLTMTSALGIRTVTQYSRHGQVVQVTDGTGAVTRYDYDRDGRLLGTTDALGHVTSNGYDRVGNRVTLTGPGTIGTTRSTTRYEYDAANRLLVQTVDPDGLKLRTAYAYDGQGRAVRMTDPAGAVTSYRFNGRGELTDAVVDDTATGLRLKTTTTYDAQGRVLSVTEGAGTPAARTTEYRYDLLGRRTQEIVDPAGQKLSTGYEYDAAGNVLLKRQALGVVTRYVHDVANRRVYTLDALGGVTRNDHDAAGRLILTTRYATRVVLDGGDAPWTLARLQAALVAAPGQDALTSYRHDADGCLRFTVDADGAVTETRRDAAGRVTHIGRLARKLPPGSAAAPDAVWQQLLAGAADPAQDSWTRQVHDAAGRLVLQVDAMGSVCGFQYDAAGRVTRTIRHAQALPAGAAALDDAALLQRVQSQADPARDAVTRTTYDAAGRPQLQVDALGAVTETRHDAAGRVIETVQYANPLPAGGALQVWRRAGTNSSAARPLGNFKAGDVVTASVRFKTSSLTGARLFLGDAGGPDPYDNMIYSPVVYGDDTWQTLQVSVTLTHDDMLWVYVYGDRDGAHADDSHSVLYDNVQVSSVQRGRVLLEEFDATALDPAWRVASMAQQVATPAADADSDARLAQRIAERADPARDRVTRRAYDAAGREVYRIDPMGGVTETRYDAVGRAVETIAYSQPIRTEHYNTPGSDPSAWYVYATGATGGTIARVDDAERGGSVISLSGDGWNTGYRLNRDAARSPWNSRNTVVSWDMKYDPNFTVYLSVQTNHGHRYLAYRAGNLPPTGAGTSEYVYHFLGDTVTEGRWHHIQRDLSADLAEMQPDTQILSVQAFLIRGSGRVGTVSLQAVATGATPAAIAAQLRPAADDRRTRTVYDAAGRIVQQVDAAGYLTTITHDALGRVQATARYAVPVQRREALEGLGAVSVLPAGSTPPATGAWLVEQDPEATARSSFEYDLLGHRTRSADLGGAVESATFNVFGDAATRTNARGGTARFLYDAMGRLIQETLPVTAPRADGTQIPVVNRYEYDARGNRVKTVEAVGLREERTTLMRFDANDRLVRRIGMAYAAVNAAGATRWVTPVDVFRHDEAGRLIEQIDHATLDNTDQPDGPVSGGRRTLTWYDPAGRKSAELSADGVLTRMAYDSAGQVLAHTVFATRLTVPALAGGPPPTVASSRDDRTVRLSYDALGRKTQTRLDGVWTWENGQPVTLNGVPDARGQVGSNLPQTLTLERLEYDTAGNVVRRFDARGNATCSYYDALGRKLLEIDPAGYATAWDYDRPGATATLETRYARAVPVAYGPAGSGTTPQAVRAALAAAGTTTDSADRSSDRVTQFKLDRLGRVLERTVLNVAFNQVDAAAGGRVVAAVAHAVTGYSFDGMGQVTQVRQRVAAGTDAGTEVWQVTDIDYDALGREKQRRAPGYTDAAGRSVRPVTDTEFDGLGRRTRSLQRGADAGSEADDRITTYAYDTAGHMVEVRAADGGVVRSVFDAQGNLSRQTHLAVRRSDQSTRDLVKTWSYDALGRVVETKDLDTNESRQTRYNAFGDIAEQGSNGGWQEWAQYTTLGKVWKTNSGDGAVKFYLHDGNGNLTREMRVGVGEGGNANLRQAALADVLADDTLAGTVNVYDARNLLVQTIEPRIGWLENGVKLKQQFTQQWVPQWDDLNVPNTPARPYPAGGVATGAAYTTVTTSDGSSLLLGKADPVVKVGGMQVGAPLDRGSSLPVGSFISFDPLDLGGSVRSVRSQSPDLMTTSLKLPTSSVANCRYRVVETFANSSRTVGTVWKPGDVIGLAHGAAGLRSVRIEYLPPGTPDTGPGVPVAEVTIKKDIYSYEPGTPGAKNVFFMLDVVSPSSGKLFLDSNDWAAADSFRVLVQQPGAAAASTSLSPAGRVGRITWFNTQAAAGNLQVLALNANGQLVAAKGISAGAYGTVWAENQRRADGTTSRTTLSWSMDGGGAAVLRWRRSDAPQETWDSKTVPASTTSLRSVDLQFAGSAPSVNGDYDFIIEQGGVMRAGTFSVNAGTLTIGENRLREFTLADEQVTLAGLAGSRARMELTLAYQVFTPDAVDPVSGRATFNLSRIRRSLGLDRWSAASHEYSYVAYELPDSGGRRATHSAHGKLVLGPPRTAAGTASFQFSPDWWPDYAAEGLIRLPAGDGKLTLTPDIGPPVELPLNGSDWRLQRSATPGGDWVVNLDTWRRGLNDDPRFVEWSYASTDGQLVTGTFWIEWDGLVYPDEVVAVTTHRPEVTLTPPTGTRTVVLEVRPAGSAAVYQRLTPKDAQTPPVFSLASWRPATGSAALDYIFSAYDGTGTLLGRSIGTLAVAAEGTTTHTPGAVQYQPARVSLQPPDRTRRVALRLTLEDGRSVALNPMEGSGWTYDLQPYVLSRTRSLDFSFETFDADGVPLTRGQGRLTIGPDGSVSASVAKEHRPVTVAFRITGRNLPQAQLSLKDGPTVLLTGTWVPPVLPVNPDGTPSAEPGEPGYTRFDWDAWANGVGGVTVDLDYTLTALDGAGNTLSDGAGRPVQQIGKIQLSPDSDAPVRLLHEVTGLNQDKTVVISRRQAHNAFGEVVEESDERVVERMRAMLGREPTPAERAAANTTLRYNALGMLVARIEAQTDITAANGYRYRDRPTTTYGYDLLGRLTTQTDANGRALRRSLLAGSADAVTQQWAADGGERRTQYDVFGDARRITETQSATSQRVTEQSFDALGRLTRVERLNVQRVNAGGVLQGARTLADSYTYDQLGQRLTHTDSLTQTTRTDYDGQGRITATVSAAGFTTSYRYEVAQGLGMHRTTTQADGRTLVDRIDYFGHTTWHRDLMGTEFTYTYDRAARLVQQTGTARPGQSKGQNIRYTYYANGYLQSSIDLSVGTRADYAYDDAGNRVRESYYRWVEGEAGKEGTRVATYQNATLHHDELNRIVRVEDVNFFDVRYEFDAVGNRRLVDSVYWDGAAGLRGRQTYWYDYDAMNRFTVTQGALSGARATSMSADVRIVAGAQGTALGYDWLGQRREATYLFKDAAKTGDPGTLIHESYGYSQDGYLQTLHQNGSLKQVRVLDAIGRTTQLVETQTKTSTISRYDADNRLLSQQFTDADDAAKNSNSTYFYYDTTSDSTSSARGAGMLARVVTRVGGSPPPAPPAPGPYPLEQPIDPDVMGGEDSAIPRAGATEVTTAYRYEYWDDARQGSITQTASTTGQTTLSYNVNGHLQQTQDAAAGLTTTYFNSASGLILARERQQRSSRVGSHYFYYADGRRIGDVSDDPNDDTHVSYAESLARDARAPQDRRELYKHFKPVTSADFDQNFEPINAAYPGPTGSHYTARGGESLAAVAQSLWGDASLWFLLAESNGLNGTETLLAGQVLWVPNKVTNIHNNSQTVRPYDAGEAIGRIDPTLPPPPPPPRGAQGCGPVATVLMVAVAVVVTIYTAGAAAGMMGVATGATTTMGAGMAVLSGGAGFGAATVAAAAIGGAMGNMTSQGIGLAMGMQDKFQWQAVGQAALSSGVASGVGSGLSELGYLPTDAGGWQGTVNAMGRAATATSVDRLLQGGWTWRAVAASAASAGMSNALTPGGQPAKPALGTWFGGVGRSMAADLAGQWLGHKDHHTDAASAFASTLGRTMGHDVVEGWPRGQATVEAQAPFDGGSMQEPADEAPGVDLAGFVAMDTDEALQQDFMRYLAQMQGKDAGDGPPMPWPQEPSPHRPGAQAPAARTRRGRPLADHAMDDEFAELGSNFLSRELNDPMWQAAGRASPGQRPAVDANAGAAVDPDGVTQGRLTFDSEGNDIPGSNYFSRRLHWPGGRSGVTLGRGYDMGSRSEKTVTTALVDAGVDPDQARAFAEGAGLHGLAARDFVESNRQALGTISTQAQNALFRSMFGTYAKRAEAQYAAKTVKLDLESATPWVDLHPAIRDVAMDFVYQQWDLYDAQVAAISSNDLSTLKEYISNDHRTSQYESGRARIPYLDQHGKR